MCLNDHRLLIPASVIRLRIVSLDTTIYPEGGKCRRADSNDIVGEDVAAVMIAPSSCTFVFLGFPDPLRRKTITFVIPPSGVGPSWWSICLFEQPHYLRHATRPLSKSDNCSYCDLLGLRGIRIPNTIH
ncbi:hypothetical protein TNCV_4689301 [Trichonephila clavipes]|nr:hypothetical protein TNCV_4689301 [Trichonephila clavipes]